ncbi:MAG: hypothetical protein ABFS32_17505 [Bacteroidota bacterium]
MPPFYDDDGTEVNPDLVPKPGLCLICEKDNDPNEYIVCQLNRNAQRNDDKFECYAFENIND